MSAATIEEVDLEGLLGDAEPACELEQCASGRSLAVSHYISNRCGCVYLACAICANLHRSWVLAYGDCKGHWTCVRCQTVMIDILRNVTRVGVL